MSGSRVMPSGEIRSDATQKAMDKANAFREEFKLYSYVEKLSDQDIEQLYKFGSFNRFDKESDAFILGEAVFILALTYIVKRPHSWYRSVGLTHLWESKNAIIASLFDE